MDGEKKILSGVLEGARFGVFWCIMDVMGVMGMITVRVN